MTGPFSRRRLLTVAAGGAALAALPVRPAFAATDDRLVQHLRGLGAVLTRTCIAKHGPEGTTP